MARIKLKVSPDTLKAKAIELDGEIKAFEKKWNHMCRTIENSKGYWEGDASNSHQWFLKENKADVTEILKRLKEHPTDLQKMAGVYVKAEKTATKLANALPKDVIR